MSTAAVSGVESLGDCGDEGTNDNWAKVVVEYKNETNGASEKDKTRILIKVSCFQKKSIGDKTLKL